ncbi:hypothetical protein EDD16DRAFT_1645526 [Pisolithus croceorrhizus]|nr:hypothetical protein EDD16DRAFT_1645526 [Pisolithus croceorrhizus]
MVEVACSRTRPATSCIHFQQWLYWHVLLQSASICYPLDPASAGYHVLTRPPERIRSSRLFILPITKTSTRSVLTLYLTTSMPCTSDSPAAVHTLASSREMLSHFRPSQLASDTAAAKNGCTLIVTEALQIRMTAGQTLAGERRLECGRHAQNMFETWQNIGLWAAASTV